MIFKDKRVAVFLDQAISSLFGLFLALYFIKFLGKTEYGFFSIFMTFVLFGQGVQNALANSPHSTIFSLKSGQESSAETSVFFLLNVLVVVLCVVSYAGFFLFYSEDVPLFSFDGFFYVMFALLSYITREAAKCHFYASGNHYKSLNVNVAGVILAAIFILLTHMIVPDVKAKHVLFCIGLGYLLQALYFLVKIKRSYLFDRIVFKKYVDIGKWALPSVVATWVSANSYSYFALKNYGLSLVADLSAARTIIMPLGLIMATWVSYYRPVISRAYSGSRHSIIEIKNKSLKLVAFISFFAALVIYVIGDYVYELLGAGYSHIGGYVYGWILLFTLTFFRTIYMSAVMVSVDGYRFLNNVSWGAMFLMLALLLSSSGLGAYALLVCLLLVEYIQLLFIRKKFQRIYCGKG